MIAFILKGFIIGLTVAIPVGPVGLLCLETTVTRGRKAGLCCACGMVCADIFSSTIMLLGMSILFNAVMDHANLVKAIAALIFAGIGSFIILSRNHQEKKSTPSALLRLALFAFILSVSPATFALMVYLFPALELNNMAYAVPIDFGVALGSALWCSLILGAGSFIKKCLGEKIAGFRTTVGILFICIGLIGAIAALV